MVPYLAAYIPDAPFTFQAQAGGGKSMENICH
jgi:hypothetical protein